MCGTIDGKGNRRPRPPRRAVQTAGDTAPQRGAAKENDDDRTDTHPPGTLRGSGQLADPVSGPADDRPGGGGADPGRGRDGQYRLRYAGVDEAFCVRVYGERRRERLLETGGHIAIYGHFIPAGTRLLTPELAGQVTYDSNFYGVERGLEPMGNVHYAPSNLSQTPAWLLARRPRVAALTCSLPDENGWMSRSLWGTALSRKVLEQCELVLAEVNPRMPNIPSDGEAHTRIHVSEVDGIIESSRPLVETPIAAGNETDSRIAGYIADLVPDGACIQLGLGGLANTVGECLAHAGKRDLGVHTEILSTGVMELMRRGVVNNSRKQTCPGRSVYANMVGGPELWAFAHENPAFCQKEIDWVNDARNIARNDHVVSINNAMEIDLTGQVNAESIGPRQYSGTGGQLEWVVGSQWSKGGKSILALRSSYRDKAGVLHSKIVPQLAPGSVVTTPRTCVQYVVTEFGVADLKYKSTVERARALIAIAHPDFRRELERQMPL